MIRSSTWAMLGFGVGIAAAVGIVAVRVSPEIADDPPHESPPSAESTGTAAARAMATPAPPADMLGQATAHMNADDKKALHSVIGEELQAGQPSQVSRPTFIARLEGTAKGDLPQTDLEKYREARGLVTQSMRGQSVDESASAAIHSDVTQWPEAKDEVLSKITTAAETARSGTGSTR